MKKRKPPPGRTGRGQRTECDRAKDHNSANTAAAAREQSNASVDLERLDWVPQAVKSIAMVWSENATAQRLLTDKRMKKVWPVLRRANVTLEAIPPPDVLKGFHFLPGQQVANLNSFERLKNWDFPDRDVSPADQGCAAFFAYAVVELGNERIIWTQAQADEFAKPWLDAAELCRRIISNDTRPKIDRKFAEALAMVGAYLEEWGRLRQQKNGSYTVKRPTRGQRHDDITRVRARTLAHAARRIFGKFLYGTVATVTMVALQVDNVRAQDVRKWCADLPLPIRLPA